MRSSPLVLAIGFVVGLVLAAAGQLTAPLHVLGHEASQAFAAAGALLILLAAGGPDPVEPEAHWGRTFLGALGLGAGFAVGMQLAMTGHGCRTGGAQLFLWVTWIPLAVLFTTLATACRWRWWARLLLYLGLAIGCLIHDGLQQLLAARTVDPLIGLPLFVDQRADMALPPIHLLGRLWLLSVGAAATAVLFAHHRTVLRPVAWSLGLLATGITLCGSHVGLGVGTAALHQTLDAEHHTEHFVFRYRTGGEAAIRIEAIGREAEWHHAELSRHWETRVEAPFQVLVFDGMTHLESTTGVGNAHATFRSMAIPWWDGLDGTFAHELVHLFHQEVAWNLQLIVLPGFVEGTAMAFDDHGYALDPAAHAGIAAALANGDLVSPEVFLHPLGFVSISESNAYRFSGSFMGFLVLEHGIERFLELQRTLDFHGTYGRDLATLEADWRSFLGQVPYTKADLARSRDRYDPTRNPGLLSRTCPKLGARERAPGVDAAEWADENAWRGALERYRALALDEPKNPRWLWGTVYALQALDRHREALPWIQRLPATPEDQHLRKVNARIHSLLAVEQWPQLYTSFDERRTLEEPDRERRTLEALLHDPSIRRSLGPVLLMGRSSPLRAGDRLQLLEDAFPQEPWEVLIASRAAPIPRRRTGIFEDQEGWSRWLDAVERTGACDDRLERAALVALDQQDCIATWGVVRVMKQVCPPSEADRIERRWDWEGCRL